MTNRKFRQFLAVWGILLATFAFLVLFSHFARSVPTGECGSSLAAQDIAGNCRVSPMTMGALEVGSGIAPVPVPIPIPVPPPNTPNFYTIPASFSAEVNTDGTLSFDNPWDHCVGRQGDNVCRLVLNFETDVLPKNKVITTAKLRVTVSYAVQGISAATWAVGRYGALGNNVKTDAPEVRIARADSWRYVIATTAYRNLGVRDLTLSPTARADLTSAIANGRVFSVFIKQNQEHLVDIWVAIGRYNGPDKPELLVSVK